MTNRQWLMEQMQNMSDEEFGEKIDFDAHIGCEHCAFKEACADRDCKVIYCPDCRINWLKSEHKEKPKLSDAERVILENVPEDYKYIVRDKNNGLKIFILKPEKECVTWIGKNNKFHFMGAYNHLFQFITWNDREPYNIEELLKQN